MKTNTHLCITIALAQANKSKSDLAVHLGIARSGVSYYMKAPSMTLETAEKIADFCGLSLTEFLKPGEQERIE